MCSAGALAFGLLGIFLGPVLLGIGYTLVNEWAGEPLPVLTKQDAPGIKAAGINTKRHRV